MSEGVAACGCTGQVDVPRPVTGLQGTPMGGHRPQRQHVCGRDGRRGHGGLASLAG